MKVGVKASSRKRMKKILLLQSSCLANSSTFILAISSAKTLATDWKSGTEIGFLSAFSNMILAFANNICIIINLLNCTCKDKKKSIYNAK